ncbi:spore coat protein, partial [Bacillus sp. JJ864]
SNQMPNMMPMMENNQMPPFAPSPHPHPLPYSQSMPEPYYQMPYQQSPYYGMPAIQGMPAM